MEKGQKVIFTQGFFAGETAKVVSRHDEQSVYVSLDSDPGRIITEFTGYLEVIPKAEPESPKMFDVGTEVWMDKGDGSGRKGKVANGDVFNKGDGEYEVTYRIYFPGGHDSGGMYGGYSEHNVASKNVYKYSPLERLARIEKELGIGD